MPYELRIAPSAARAIAVGLPEKLALQVLEFITGELLRDPIALGTPLLQVLDGLWIARRESFTVTYRIDQLRHTIQVSDVDSRSEIYRRR